MNLISSIRLLESCKNKFDILFFISNNRMLINNNNDYVSTSIEFYTKKKVLEIKAHALNIMYQKSDLRLNNSIIKINLIGNTIYYHIVINETEVLALSYKSLIKTVDAFIKIENYKG